jgi:uroporphyrinogen-III decarboxylase
MNPHAIALEESKKGFVIDIAEVDAIVGDRSCLFGNFDAITLLERGDERELVAEIDRQLAVGRARGRFASSLGSPVTPRTSTAQVRRWVDLSRERSRVG